MFYPTVFTSCLFAVINLLILARPVQGSKPLRHDIIARAAAKGTHALSQRNKGDLITRQDYNSWAEGDPAYLADVVSWACDTVSEDLHDTCVEEVTAYIQDSTFGYCTNTEAEITLCLDEQDPPQDCTDSQVSFDACANNAIATYDYCIGLGHTTLPELPDCANSELFPSWGDGSEPTATDDYGTDWSAPTTTEEWTGYTETPETTPTDYWYGYGPETTTTTVSGTGYTSTRTFTSFGPTTTVAHTVITTVTAISTKTYTQVNTFTTTSGSSTIRVTNSSVIASTLFSSETLTPGTRSGQSTSTGLTTIPTTYITTTTSGSSTYPVTVTSSAVSTIYSCSGGCTRSTPTASAVLTTYPTTYVTTTTSGSSTYPVTVTSSVVSTSYGCFGGCTRSTPTASAALTTYPTTYVTTTTSGSSTYPVTITSSVVSSIYSCPICAHSTPPPSATGSLCVRKSRVRLVTHSTSK